MAAMITIMGIDEVLSNLPYRNKNTLKSRLPVLVRSFYDHNDGAPTVEKIDRDDLIRSLWDLGDDLAAIKNKRRNFSSVKSSVNKDLRNFYEQGRNPEGIILGPDNLFAMCNDAKDRILENLSDTIKGSGTANLDKIGKVLETVNEILSDPNALPDSQGAGTQEKLDQLKNVLQSISSSIGAASPHSAEQSGPEINGEGLGESQLSLTEETDLLEEVKELEEAEEVEEVEDLEEGEFLEEEEAEEIEEIPEEPPEVLEEPEEVLEEADEVLEEPDEEEAELEEVLEEAEVLAEAEGLAEMPEEPPEVLENAEEEVEFEEVEDLEEIDDTDLIEAAEESDGEPLSEDLDDEAECEGTNGKSGSEPGSTEAFGLPVENLGQSFMEGELEPEEEIGKTRLLAEEFDGYLGTMDRFYNHYLIIPAGIYLVGSKTPRADMVSERTVDLESFYIGRFPVTNALFEIFIEKTGYKTTAEKQGYGTVYEGRYRKTGDPDSGRITLCWQSAVTIKKVKGACWFQPSGPGSTLHNKRSHPVVQVSLGDAIAFAAWTGKRLPCEEEWEAAARTSKAYVYPWNNEWKEDQSNLEESREGSTTPVDRFASHANELGIADTLGNVMEWTLAQDHERSHEGNGIRYCVAKGGNWASSCKDTTLCSRHLLEPGSHSNLLGFRCVAY